MRVTTDDGVVGWSEYDENLGVPGLTEIIEELGATVVGEPVASVEGDRAHLVPQVRQSYRRRDHGPRGHRERRARREGEGARRPLRGPAGRQGVRGGAGVLVALRELPHHRPEYYEPVETLDDVVSLGEEVRESQFGA